MGNGEQGVRGMTHTFFVDERPRAKGRPRMTKSGRTYTPKATVDAEKAIAAVYDGPSFDGPVLVKVDYHKDGQEITIISLPDDRGSWVADIDNLVKLTLDGLQREGGPLENDKQVVSLVANKY